LKGHGFLTRIRLSLPPIASCGRITLARFHCQWLNARGHRHFSQLSTVGRKPTKHAEASAKTWTRAQKPDHTWYDWTPQTDDKSNVDWSQSPDVPNDDDGNGDESQQPLPRSPLTSLREYFYSADDPGLPRNKPPPGESPTFQVVGKINFQEFLRVGIDSPK